MATNTDWLEFNEQGSDPGTPAASKWRLFTKSDGLYIIDDGGNVSGPYPTSALSNPMTTSGDIIYGGASGTPTRLPKATDGQILRLASGLPSWDDETSGATGIGWIDQTGHPDKVPGSPNTEDDEFNAGTLDAKWTHTGTGTTAFANSHMRFTLPAAAGSEYIMQAYTPGAGVAFTITAAFRGAVFVGATDFYGLMCHTSGDAIVAGCRLQSSSTSAMQLHRENNAGGSQFGVHPAMGMGVQFYLRLSRDASNVWTSELSLDGRIWSTHGASTVSDSGTVAKIGMRFGQTGTVAYKGVAVDWFRRT